MDDDLRGAIADVPSTFVFGEQSCQCVASPIRRTNEMQSDVGEFLNYDMEASVVVADLSALPEVRDSVTVDGVVYYVEDREADSRIAKFMLRRKT